MKLQQSEMRLNSFAEMNLGPSLMAALEKMGIADPTAVQSQTMPVALSGTDMITVAQTGSGKTLAFALSILASFDKKPQSRALVLAPSREMAIQIHKVFEALCEETSISSCLVIGGLPGNKQDSQLKKKPRLIVATPGRMNDLLRNNKLLLQKVETVVIDEADRMLDLGFVPQLKDIQSTMRGTWQTMLFSASFNADVEAVARIFMKTDAVMIRCEQAEAPVSSLQQRLMFIAANMKNNLILDELNATENSVIVFTGSQENCEKVGAYLKEYGHATDFLHGGLSQGHRNRILRNFRDGTLRILVTTDLLARGLDVPSVEHVINFDLPFEAEDFLHRIGRTARAGRKGTAITFVTPSDGQMFEKIKPYLQGAKLVKPDPKFSFTSNRAAKKTKFSRARKTEAPRFKSRKK